MASILADRQYTLDQFKQIENLNISKELDSEIITITSPKYLGKGELSIINLDSPLREARDSFERIYLSYQLAKLQGSMTRLAERSGLERTHLYRKIRQLGMELQRGVLKKNNQQLKS